jgi:uncharacterized protein YraI
MTLRLRCGAMLALVLLGVGLTLSAQDTPPDDPCATPMQAIWQLSTEACVGKPQGYICNGASPPIVEPAGPVAFALQSVGGLVEVDAVDSLRTVSLNPLNNSAGVAYVRLMPPVEVTLLLLGEVTVRDVTPEGFPTWQAITVETTPGAPICSHAPENALIAQVLAVQPTGMVINGLSLDIAGTLMIRTTGTETVLTALYGGTRVTVLGQQVVMWAGEEIRVPYTTDLSVPSAAPNAPAPLELTGITNLPVALFDRAFFLPQPGFVRTQGNVNMRSAPSTSASLVAEVPPGTVLTVLGRNTAGDWLHVEGFNGLTGWMFAELLEQRTGTINAVYEDTPAAPIRYAQPIITATVSASDGATVRSAPEVSFPAIASLPFGTEVNLIARSPYSPWVQVEGGGVTGWVALITIQTNSYIEALPIEYDVPPPPGPTRVPGSWGNAFPDPRAGGG